MNAPRLTQIKETCLYVNDIKRTKEFYHELLGLELISELEGNHIFFRVGNDVEVDGPRNDFSGTFPAELWELSRLEYLHIGNLPNLHGRVPSEILMPNLTLLSLSGSPHLSGTIPGQACVFIEELDFDCSDVLCGCHCPCIRFKNKNNL